MNRRGSLAAAMAVKFCDICQRLWGRVEDERAPYVPPDVVVCPGCWAKVEKR